MTTPAQRPTAEPISRETALILQQLAALHHTLAGIERFLEALCAEAPGKYGSRLTRHWRNRHHA